MVSLETAWPNGQPWPRRRLGALPRCNWQGFKVTKPSSTSTEMSRRRANRSQSRFYQKNDKLSFIFINHDLSIDLVSLVPAKQFAPVVVLKAGLVRFPMLSPPSDSTYWGHLRKNVPGQCRKRAEFVGHFWWEIPCSESILGFTFHDLSPFHPPWFFTRIPTTSEEDSDSKLGKIRAMACGSDTVGCRPWGWPGQLRERKNWHKKPKPEKVTKVIDGYIMDIYGYLWILLW